MYSNWGGGVAACVRVHLVRLVFTCFVGVFREEWEWLRRLGTNTVATAPTAAQAEFQTRLVSACETLLQKLGE